MPAPASQSVNRYLQAMLPEWFGIDITLKRGDKAAPGKLSIGKAAKLIGVSKPSLYEVIRSAKGAGPDFEERIAALRFNNDVTALRNAARAWVEEHGGEVSTPQPQPTAAAGERDRLIDEVGRRHGADPRDVEMVQAVRRLLRSPLDTPEKVVAELERQRRVREDRERDEELEALRRAARERSR